MRELDSNIVKSATAVVFKTSTRDAHNSQKTQGSLDFHSEEEWAENDTVPEGDW